MFYKLKLGSLTCSKYKIASNVTISAKPIIPNKVIIPKLADN